MPRPIALRVLDADGNGIACEASPCPCERVPVDIPLLPPADDSALQQLDAYWLPAAELPAGFSARVGMVVIGAQWVDDAGLSNLDAVLAVARLLEERAAGRH